MRRCNAHIERPMCIGVFTGVMTLLLPLAANAQSATSGTERETASTTASREAKQAENERSGETATQLSASELAERASRYYDERVSVTGPVEDIYSRTTFSLDEDNIWSTGRDVLVLNPNPTARVSVNQEVTVTGTLHPFDQTEIERIYDDWDWDVNPELLVEFDRRPVLIADSVQTAQGKELVAETDTAGDDSEAPAATEEASAEHPSIEAAPTTVTAGNLADDPKGYYGTEVSVTADVEDIYSRSVFALDEDKVWSTGEDVLVVARDLEQPVNDEMYVTVVGDVVQFDEANIEGLVNDDDLELDPDIADYYNERPVIIASSVVTEAGEQLLDSDN